MNPRDLSDFRASVRHVPIVDVDREEFARALFLQGYSAERAIRIALHELEDNDGALQMLARHRIASALDSAR